MMKMEFRYIALSILLTSFTFAGCSHFEEDDLFDEDAALRVTHFNADLKSRLVAQSTNGNNGWVIQYFVGDNNFEGFNLCGGFYENGKVTLGSNHRFLRNGKANSYTESSSAYEMLQEEGPVLALNTWNDILTVFVDPVDPSSAPSSLYSNGEGMRGDQNLVFQGFEGDNIMFRGERNSGTVRFLPCDRPWEQYMKDTEANKNYITNTSISSYYVICGTDTLFFKNLRSGVITYCERIDDPLFPSTINCVFSPTGFYLKNKNHIGRTSFREFTLSPDKTCLKSENDSVKVFATWDNYIVNVFHNGLWNFDQDKLSDVQKDLLAQINAEFKKYNKNYSLAHVGLGRSTGAEAVKGVVFTFYTNSAKTKTNTTGLSLTSARSSFGKVRLLYSDSEKADKNLTVFNNKCNAEAIVRQFAATLSGTYDIVPNNNFLPTECELRAGDGGNSYVLKQP